MDRQTVFDYIKKKYHVLPEYPWRKYDSNAVFRHTDNKKWFALVMDVQGNKLGLSGSEYIDVVNLKMDDLFFRDIIIKEDGIMPAYHMNKMHWVTVLLNGMVPEKRVLELIDMSFLATASAKKKEKVRPPKEWIIPSNPKYYDIIHAFDETDTIDWKQGAGIKMGDTVFMYVGAPVSAVLYKCKVTETNIPYQYQDKKRETPPHIRSAASLMASGLSPQAGPPSCPQSPHTSSTSSKRLPLTISALMKIRLLKRYAPEQFTFEVLKSEYGIYAIRGPRGVPNSLSSALKG